jgi:adenylate cyclase
MDVNSTLQDCTILVVDENVLVHRAMQRIFQRQGMKCLFASKGSDALQIAKSQNVDAIVLDTQLEDGDGLKMCELARQDSSLNHIPIIIITALNDPDVHVQAFNAGADDFVPKPPPTKVLLQRLANCIARRKAEEENGLLVRQLERYISSAAINEVINSFGVQNIHATILFSDMRGFTAASFDHDVSEVFTGINEALCMQSEIIQEFGGYVDGFSGDGMLAVFDNKDGALRACRAASKIIRLARTTKVDIWDPLPIGIGINSGEVVRGDLGSEQRRAHTVIGSTVNISARLCGVAKAMEAVCSEYVISQVNKEFEFNAPQTVQLKGLPAPIKAYSLKVE